MKKDKLTRRDFLKNTLTLAGGLTLLTLPRFVWAELPTEQRLLVVVLRGAMDGLGAVPALGDPHYQQARGALAFQDKGFLPLNTFFALNAAAAPFQKMFTDNELLILHAAATPYRDRSHFDGQDLLENGTIKPHALKTGWLGRTIDSLGGTVKSLAIGPSVPLLLLGQQNTESWSPSILPQASEDFLMRVSHMYAADPLLSKTVNPVLKEANTLKMADNAEVARSQQFLNMMQMAAQFMVKENGARVASIDAEGWDTHAGQGLDQGRLGQALKNLSNGIVAFKEGMGTFWAKTAVLVVTEFGRTVMVNGSGGTDHGTGSAAFLVGGNVNGGRVIGEWPGLSPKALYQGRDLYPANDLRSLPKLS